jgi:outer membrane lipoprotein SlyB
VQKIAKNQIDLFFLFNQVVKTIQDSQASLNKADTYNHDHRDNMVNIFEVITQAMKEKKNADPADQLEYAASLLRGQAKSGSGKLYAQGLNEAAKQIVGKELNAGSIMSMVQTVLGAGEAPTSKTAVSGDVLGSLLGSLVGGGKADDQDNGLGLGDLLGSLSGAGSSDAKDDLDLGDLLGVGMDYLSAKQGGKSTLEALTGALVSGSQMASSPYREQSSQLVTSTLLKGLTSMLSN